MEFSAEHLTNTLSLATGESNTRRVDKVVHFLERRVMYTIMFAWHFYAVVIKAFKRDSITYNTMKKNETFLERVFLGRSATTLPP